MAAKIEEVDREQRLRDLSKEMFGEPNSPLKVIVHNLEDLFGVDISQFTVEQLKGFALHNPEIQKLTHITLVDDPQPPIRVTTSSTVKFLSRSRYFRMLFPMLDRLSKRVQIPSGDSTRLKFDIGLGLGGAFHVGAGSIVASSVPEAGTRVDIHTGDNVFAIKARSIDRVVVSDVAMPTQDGLGCSSNPMLVEWLEDLALRGNHIVAKLTIEDLPYVTVPYKLVHKPRPHNAEVIVTFNIPGVDLMGHGDLLQSIVDANVWRNTQCAQGFIDGEKPLDESRFNETLLSDPRDWSEYGARPVLPFYYRNQRMREGCPPFDKNKCLSMIEGGFLQITDNINMFTVKRLQQLHSLEERVEFLAPYHTEAEAASLITLLKFVDTGTMGLWKRGVRWQAEQEKMF